MNLSLYIDAQNRKLVSGATNATPITLDGFIREDTVSLVITLLMPTGSITSPFTLVDISNLTMKVALGERDGTANALQTSWTKDTTAGVMTFSGNLVIHTTEIDDLLTAASGDTIEQWLEVEVQDSGKIWTLLQYKQTITKDVIRNSQITPSNVAAPSVLATSMADILTDGVTVEWTKSGDDITGHIKGLAGLSNLTGDSGKHLSVKTNESGFELTTPSSSIDDLGDLTDTDLTSNAPSNGDHLSFDSADSKWKPSSTVPSHLHALDSLSDVTAASPSNGQIIKFDSTTSTFILASEGAAQNLWETITADSGSVTANSLTDSLKLQGGESIDTSIAGDVVTISAEQASDTNKGVATFNATNFTVSSGGDVTLKNVPISSGGTGQSNREDSYDALSPMNSEGDLETHDGSNAVRLAKGTAGQVLKVNSGATAVEWSDESGGGGNAFETISVAGQSSVVAEQASDTLTLIAGTNVTLLTDASADSVTISSAGGGGNAFETISVAGQSSVVAEQASDTLTLVAGTNVTLVTDASADSVTISAAGGGTASHSVISNGGSTTDGTYAITIDGDELQSILDVSHSNGATLSTTGTQSAGNMVTVRFTCNHDVLKVGLVFPVGWNWISPIPTAISMGETALLTLTSFGTNPEDIVAAYAPSSIVEDTVITKSQEITT